MPQDALAHHQQAAGEEERAHVTEAAAEVGDGVEDVGGDHHVEALAREALDGGIGLEVEPAIPDEAEVPKAASRPRKGRTATGPLKT